MPSASSAGGRPSGCGSCALTLTGSAQVMSATIVAAGSKAVHSVGVTVDRLWRFRLPKASREATVTGKGNKQRIVRFTYDTARVLDRYSRERARHPLARVSALWSSMMWSGGEQVPDRGARDRW